MPISLPNTTVADTYPPAGQGGAQVLGRDIFNNGWFTVANNPVVCQYQYGQQGQFSNSPEFFLAPGTYPIFGTPANPLNGIRFRNAVAGKNAQVWGGFFYKDDPVISSSNEFTSIVTPGGGVTPGNASVQIQKNGALIGTEPILNYNDAAGVHNWTITDDLANTRVQITPIWAAALQHPGDIYSTFGASGQIRLTNSGGVPVIYFGSAQDVNIYREQANVLKTDSQFKINWNSSIALQLLGTGSGLTANGDTNLYRVGAGVWQMDGSLQLGTGSAGGAIFYNAPATGSIVFSGIATNNGPNPYFSINALGTLGWGPGGVSAIDTDLYRIGVNYLKTDGGLVLGAAGLNIRHNSTPIITFGAGDDTNLYRGAAARLKTDGAMEFGSSPIRIVGTSGGSFTLPGSTSTCSDSINVTVSGTAYRIPVYP